MPVEYDLNGAMVRLAAMQKEAITGCDAVPYWPYEQEAGPYWWNRINGLTVETELSADYIIDRYSIEMGLVIAHLTQGYTGQNYDKVAEYITSVLTYFDLHPMLDTVSGDYADDELEFIWPEEGGAMITGIPGGTRTVNNSGVGATQIYLGFILDLPLLRQVF
jgi:hypothetical protein